MLGSSYFFSSKMAGVPTTTFYGKRSGKSNIVSLLFLRTNTSFKVFKENTSKHKKTNEEKQAKKKEATLRGGALETSWTTPE